MPALLDSQVRKLTRLPSRLLRSHPPAAHSLPMSPILALTRYSPRPGNIRSPSLPAGNWVSHHERLVRQTHWLVYTGTTFECALVSAIAWYLIGCSATPPSVPPRHPLPGWGI